MDFRGAITQLTFQVDGLESGVASLFACFGSMGKAGPAESELIAIKLMQVAGNSSLFAWRDSTQEGILIIADVKYLLKFPVLAILFDPLAECWKEAAEGAHIYSTELVLIASCACIVERSIEGRGKRGQVIICPFRYQLRGF